jgi:site-specific recombinase XerD
MSEGGGVTTGFSSGPIVPIWTAAMKADNQAAETIRRRVGTLRRFTRYLGRDPRTANPDEIVLWLARFRTPATRNAYFGDLRAFWDWMLLSGREVADPTRKVKYPKRPPGTPRPVETEDLLRVLGQETGDVRAMVALGSYEGLRRFEIAKVHSKDFLAGDVMYVLGKGGHEAVIAVHELVAAEARQRSGFWFPGSDGGHVHREEVGEAIVGAFARVGVTATAHMLRHWCGTELLRNGATLREVQEHLRHRSVTSSQVYTRVLRQDLAIAVARLPVAV